MSKRFVFIGHVDTGKSTVAGHLLYKCGYVDKHEMTKIISKAEKDKMSRWVWARVLDIFDEEMERGKTHEFTEIDFSHNNNNYTLIDTPGHKAFVRSMISGISNSVKIGVLLVSMKKNEFESSFERGMLKEHLILSRAAGVRHLIILGNKMDLIKWDQDTYNNYIGKVKNFLQKIKWNPKLIYDIPISGFEGNGLIDLDGIPEWYKGDCFIDILQNIKFKKKHVLGELINTDKINLKLNILYCESIITKGFSCIMHYGLNEIEIIISNINGKIFGKAGDILDCEIQLPYNININNQSKVIFRKDDYTLGFGTINII